MIRTFLAILLVLGISTPVLAGGAVTGTASWYGPGNGVAMPFCTWTYRHTNGCGAVLITSVDTGLSTVAPVIDYCQCYVGTPQERIIDLQWGVVSALGLDISRGLYLVTVQGGVEPILPDASMAKHQKHKIAPHWVE